MTSKEQNQTTKATLADRQGATQGPLHGLRILDLSSVVSGPMAAVVLADQGADVIKVEPLAGERLRGAGGAKTPLSFAMLNSNKKSITLNLRDEEGKKLLRELSKTLMFCWKITRRESWTV